MIRQFDAQDTDAVVEVWSLANALAHPFQSASYVAQIESDLRSLYLPNAETWVFCERAIPVGFIALVGNEIGGLFVKPELHGQGIGKSLVDHAVRLRKALTVEVFEKNVIGLPFYERFGFERLSQNRHEPTGETVLVMGYPPRA